MITDRIGRQEILLPINHNHFNFRKKIHLQQIPPVETMSLVKYSSILEIALFFFGVITGCYSYYSSLFDMDCFFRLTTLFSNLRVNSAFDQVGKE